LNFATSNSVSHYCNWMTRVKSESPSPRRRGKIEHLIRHLTDQDAKMDKEEPPCLLCAVNAFAPLRETLFLSGRLFHGFEAFPHPSADGPQSRLARCLSGTLTRPWKGGGCGGNSNCKMVTFRQRPRRSSDGHFRECRTAD
jgi:hypothetical protein